MALTFKGKEAVDSDKLRHWFKITHFVNITGHIPKNGSQMGGKKCLVFPSRLQPYFDLPTLSNFLLPPPDVVVTTTQLEILEEWNEIIYKQVGDKIQNSKGFVQDCIKLRGNDLHISKDFMWNSLPELFILASQLRLFVRHLSPKVPLISWHWI